MRSELRPVERIGTLRRATTRTMSRLAGAVPVVLLTLSACQADGASEGSPESIAVGENPHEGVPGVPADFDAEAMQRRLALMTELQAIDQVLAPVRQQAMQDDEMRAREQVVIQQVDDAMESITPGIEGMRARFDSLRTEYGAAQGAGEEERLQSLAGELQSLQGSLQETQSQALQQEDISSAIDGFRQDLFDRMRAIDPSADSLLNRAEEITEELEAAAPAGTGGSGS